MTNAAKAFGKQLQHFWNSPDTHQYLQARAESMGKSSGFDDLYETHRGYHGGTWARPKLAVFFARTCRLKSLQSGEFDRVSPKTSREMSR
jgi:hypothetical protein